jgi:hypothetical protein
MPIVEPSGGGGGGGGSAPTTRAQYFGNPVSIDNGDVEPLTWDTLGIGTALLDITDPAAPTIVTAGTYAVSVTVMAAQSMTATGFFNVTFEMDQAGEDPSNGSISSPTAIVAQSQPVVVQTLVYYVPAGGILGVVVTNEDGAKAVSFELSAVVQRLS